MVMPLKPDAPETVRRQWTLLGAILTLLGLLGHLFAARALGGTHIAFRDHIAGFLLIALITGAIIFATGCALLEGPLRRLAAGVRCGAGALRAIRVRGEISRAPLYGLTRTARGRHDGLPLGSSAELSRGVRPRGCAGPRSIGRDAAALGSRPRTATWRRCSGTSDSAVRWDSRECRTSVRAFTGKCEAGRRRDGCPSQASNTTSTTRHRACSSWMRRCSASRSRHFIDSSDRPRRCA